MFMHFALHLQRTSRVPFIRKEELKRGRGHQPRQVVGCYTAGERYTTGVHLPYVCIVLENNQSECPAT